MKDTWPAVIALVAGVVASAWSIAKEARSEHTDAAAHATALVVLSVGAAALMFLGGVKIAQSLFKEAREDKRLSPDELRGCLFVLHRAIAGWKGSDGPPEGWLRITLHKVDLDKGELEQSVEYVGSEDTDKAGRRFLINAGLIGVVARTGEMRGFEREATLSFEGWCDHLVEDYGMTRDAAWGTRKDRFSFLGVPIKSPGGKEVRAVVYLDANEPGFFDNDVAELIVSGCEGLAAWIDEHYYTK